jgi:hypothetical protein
MDTITLVEELIADGRRLIDRLVRESIPVIMACWVKPVEGERWSLHIATPLLDEKGAMRAYRDVYRVLRSLGKSWVTDSDITLIGRDDPITKDVLDIMARYPGATPIRSRRPQLGNVAVEETYVYPSAEHEAKPARQSFMVGYFRRDGTNEWDSRTSRGEFIKATEAQGAVGYSTAHWGGEAPADVKHAEILVLLEVDPELTESVVEGDPELVRALAKQANETADQTFKQRHPDAVILRRDD